MQKLFFIYLFLLMNLCISAATDVEDKKLLEEMKKAVVTILNYNIDGKPINQASGFFINEDGHVITNYHVMKHAFRAKVKTHDGEELPVKLVLAANEITDLIKLSVDTDEKPCGFAQITGVLPKKDQEIIVIGSPNGEHNVSRGHVLAIQNIPSIGNLLQISIPSVPGASGSPVFNMSGQVIGIHTFGVREYDLNFAACGEDALKLKPQGKPLSEWASAISYKEKDYTWNLYNRGHSFLRRKDYDKALECFINVNAARPGNAKAYFYAGYCNSQLGRHEESIKSYEQMIKIEPVNAEDHLNHGLAYLNLGITYAKVGRNQDAIESLTKAIGMTPVEADVCYNLGVVYGKSGDRAEAIKAYSKAISLRPDHTGGLLNLGVAYGKAGRYQDAVDLFNKVIHIDPDNADAYFNLGIYYVELKQYTDAIKAFKKTIETNPESSDVGYSIVLAYSTLGYAYNELGQYEEAIRAYEEALRLNPQLADVKHNLGLAYLYIGNAFMNAGDSHKAIDAYKQAVIAHPNSAETYYNMGNIYGGRLQQYPEAIEAFKRAIEINPGYAKAYFYMGLSYASIRDKENAMKQYEILKTLDDELASKLYNMINK